MLPGLRDLGYEQHLTILLLPSLLYSRLMGDMIETYKILTGKYDNYVMSDFGGYDIMIETQEDTV